MAQIKLENFARAVRRASDDATVRVDLDTGQLKVGSGNNRFRRVISWFRSKLSRSAPDPDPVKQQEISSRREVESSSAYNSFLRAIANDFYSQKDLDAVSVKLKTDHAVADISHNFQEKGLSARLVKEVIGQLKESPRSARRQFVKVAYYMSSRKDPEGDTPGIHLSRTVEQLVSDRPALRDMGYRMGTDRKQALSERVFSEVMKEVESSSDEEVANLKLSDMMRRGEATATRIINEVLDEEEVHYGLTQPAASATETSEAKRAPADATGATAATGQASSGAEGVKERRDALFQHLKALNIPDRDKLKASLQKANPNEADIDASVNRHTIQWIEDKRLQRWFKEALPSGQKSSPVPLELRERVREGLATHAAAHADMQAGILPYDQAEAKARAIIGHFVAESEAASPPPQVSPEEAKGIEERQEAFFQHLKALKIPDREGLKASLQRSNPDEASKDEFVNRHTIQWIEEKRLQSWYKDALPPGRKSSTAPPELRERVRKELAAHATKYASMQAGVLPYDQAEAQSRAIIGHFVEKSEAGSLPSQLAAAKLPGEVEKQVRKSIGQGQVTDRRSLAQSANRHLAQWVATNRVNRWYQEELKTQGAKFGKDESQLIMQKLVDNISDHTTKRPEMWAYSDLKDFARRLVRSTVTEHKIRAEYKINQS